MASVDLVDLKSWLQIPAGGETTAAVDAQTLQSRIADVSRFTFPEEVCAAVGEEALVVAVSQGLLGPRDAAYSILCNSQLFTGNDAEQEVGCTAGYRISNDLVSEGRLEHQQQQQQQLRGTPAHHPKNVLLPWRQRFEQALFDSPTLSYVSFLLAAVARLLFTWLPRVPAGVEFVTFFALLLTICANRCAVRKTLESHYLLSLTNAVLHVCLILSSSLMSALPFAFPSSLLTHGAAIGIMLTSYTEMYMFRFLSQSLTLGLVLLDGYLPSVSDEGDALSATCSVQASLPSNTALTLVFCLSVSSFMSEAVKYTKRKSYSGK